MSKKVLINIVYSPQTQKPHKFFENEYGEIWHSKRRDESKHNISMSFYSIRRPQPEDSLLVIEPYCVSDREYNIKYNRKFKYIFTWATPAFTEREIINKVVEINHPSCLGIDKVEHGTDWIPWKKKANEIVFIANNKKSQHESELYTLRIALADYFYEHSKYKVSWYGQMPLDRPYFMGKTTSKQRVLRNVKFSVCCENSYHPIYTHNYFTEKMPEVWKAGAIPLYMGCYNIDSFGYQKESYIDLRKYVTIGNTQGAFNIKYDQLLHKIENYSEKQYMHYKHAVLKNILKPDALFKQISYTRMYETMIKHYLVNE